MLSRGIKRFGAILRPIKGEKRRREVFRLKLEALSIFWQRMSILLRIYP